MTGSKHHYLVLSVVIVMAIVLSALVLLWTAPLARAQEKGAESLQTTDGAYPPPTVFALGFKWTNVYLFPSAPRYFECCTGRQPPEIFRLRGAAVPQAAETQAGDPPRSVVKPNPRSTRLLKAVPTSVCVDLATLSPLERALRQAQAHLGQCVRFVTYDHFPCQCETSCVGQGWLCNCPGVPPGQLPEIKPQDSLGSQPELLGTFCTPCNNLSMCP